MSEISNIEPDSEIDAKEMRTFILNRMWESLDENEQDEAFIAFWKCGEATTKKTRTQIIKMLAETLRFRPVFIERAPIEKKVGFLKKVVHTKPFCFYFDDFIRAWLVQNCRPLLKAFLDGASIPNDDGFATEDEHPTTEQFEAGIASITGRFSQRDVALYVVYFALFGGSSGFWSNLGQTSALQTMIDQLGLGENYEVSKDGGDETENAEPESNTEGFTTLDNHLIKTLVASAFQEEGALGEDAIEDLVDEVVEMNSSRQRSLFHRGYFHALFEREFSFHFPGENSERRQWYLCGVLFGLLRRNQVERCVEIFAVSEKELGAELAGSPESPCGPKLLPQLCLPLLRASHLKFAIQFARCQLPKLTTTSQRAGVIHGLLGHGSKLLREGKSAEAEPIFDLLQDFVNDEECELPNGFRLYIGPWVKRRKAQCLQAKGSFSAAKTMLGEFDFEDPDPNVSPYKALTDLGLIEGGFRSLAAVLPKPGIEQNKALIEGLKRGVTRFEKAIEVGDELAANAHFCMGVLQTLETPTQVAQDRADRFQIAMGGMLDDTEAYSSTGILDWTRFLLALALLETGEPSNYLPAAELIPPVIEIELRFSAFLWERMFEAAALFDDPSLAILIGNYLLSCREEASECLLANAALLARSEPLFEAVLDRFLARKIPVRKCWSHLEKLLPEALQYQAIEVAGTILDRMESMAFTNKEFRGAIIELLENSDRYSPAWETEDAQEALVNLLEIDGKKVEAAQILRERFFHVRASGSQHHAIAARQVLERLQDLHGDPTQFEDLSELLNDSGASEPSNSAGSSITGRVLYIGGNETQESYRGRLLKELGEEHVDLSVEFYFPGWTSNWNVHLAKLKPMIDRADVVVINPLIRTQLGRHLRGYCNAEHPWLPCTGRGYDSLLNSILRAAAWASERKQETPIK